MNAKPLPRNETLPAILIILLYATFLLFVLVVGRSATYNLKIIPDSTAKSPPSQQKTPCQTKARKISQVGFQTSASLGTATLTVLFVLYSVWGLICYKFWGYCSRSSNEKDDLRTLYPAKLHFVDFFEVRGTPGFPACLFTHSCA